MAAACVSQRTTEYGTGFAIDESRIRHASATAVGEPVVGLAVVVGGNAERRRVDGAACRVECRCEVIVAAVAIVDGVSRD